MRIVALEEHFCSPEMVRRISPDVAAARGWPRPTADGAVMGPTAQLADLGAGRLADMDASGLTVQVLSASGPGAELLEPEAGVAFARDYNNMLEAAAKAAPDRLAGFAHMPMTAPEAAADELERCVRDLGFKGALINGTTNDLFLDHPSFEPILARAEALDVPIYLHPGLPPQAVREAYYSGLPHPAGFALSIAGWGWHSEVAMHILRLVVSGTLERHRGLKLIIGHMGEGLPMMLTRVDDVFTGATKSYLSRSVSQTILDQVWITNSGFFSLPPFLAAMASFGADRILFSVDYPYSPNKRATDYLRTLPVSPADLAKIAHGNADALLKL